MVETRVHVQLAESGPTGRATERSRPLPGPGALPSLEQVEHTAGRSVPVVPPTDGLIYRGRLMGYARDRDGQRYAVVDTGRELVAFRAETAELVAGRHVRATTHDVEEDRRRRLIWRLGDDERERQRERAR